MEHLIFHHNGREYTVYDALTADEIRTIAVMGEERDRRLNPLNPKSTRKYFEDTDKMVAAILRRRLLKQGRSNDYPSFLFFHNYLIRHILRATFLQSHGHFENRVLLFL